MADPVRIVQFTDVLCVWAYVGQVRMDELTKNLAERVQIERRFVSVFGDVHGKIAKRWGDKGGSSAYGAHVRDVVDGFSHVTVHPDIWRKVLPHSSLPCHLFLAGIRHLEDAGKLKECEPEPFIRACWRLREAFFGEVRDVSQWRVQAEIAEECGLPVEAIRAVLDSGAAHAEVCADYELARGYSVSVSPALILNEGRQRLIGNVGYRLIETNVLELFARKDFLDSSWC